MDDGNKESTKEMLNAFRSIASADLAIGLGLAAARTRYPESIGPVTLYLPGTLFAVSFLAAIYLFMLAISKLAEEEPDPRIIEMQDIKGWAKTSFYSFLTGIFCLLLCLFVPCLQGA
jgi:hypothetical protein